MPCTWCKKPLWPKPHRGRHGAAAQQDLRAADIAEHTVEQVGALRDPGFDLGPFGERDQKRQRVHLPPPVGALGVGVDVVGNAVLADLPLHQRQRLAHLRPCARGEGTQEGVLMRPRRARCGQQLVVASFENRVVLEQRGQHRRVKRFWECVTGSV